MYSSLHSCIFFFFAWPWYHYRWWLLVFFSECNYMYMHALNNLTYENCRTNLRRSVQWADAVDGHLNTSLRRHRFISKRAKSQSLQLVGAPGFGSSLVLRSHEKCLVKPGKVGAWVWPPDRLPCFACALRPGMQGARKSSAWFMVMLRFQTPGSGRIPCMLA